MTSWIVPPARRPLRFRSGRIRPSAAAMRRLLPRVLLALAVGSAWVLGLPGAPGGGAAALLAQAPGTSREKKPKSSGVKPASAKPGVAKAAPPDKASKAEPAPAAPSGETFVQKAVTFIKAHALWIVGGLGAVLLGLLFWAVLSARRASPGEDPFAELGLGGAEPASAAASSRRFSSTRIEAADVKDRLARAVKTTEVETEREYALVVDEEALKMPPLPEEAGDAARAESAPIEKLLAENDVMGAYAEYAKRIGVDPGASFEPALERSLSEQLIRSRKLAEAARVLEHHVSSQPREMVQPDCYFNLGYIHFMNKAPKKSSRFLKLFVKVENNPAHVERAMRILRKIESSGSPS